MPASKTEYYERSPDGATWPGDLKGLLLAINATAWESALHQGQEFTLSAIRDGHAVPIRVYRNGKQVEYKEVEVSP